MLSVTIKINADLTEMTWLNGFHKKMGAAQTFCFQKRLNILEIQVCLVKLDTSMHESVQFTEIPGHKVGAKIQIFPYTGYVSGFIPRPPKMEAHILLLRRIAIIRAWGAATASHTS